MNLKLVVASMCALSLISSAAVFADTTDTTSSTTTNTNTTVKKHHHRHHKMKHHVAHQMEVHHDYKDMGNLPVQAEPACMISQTSMIMDEATQNMGRSLPSACNPGWFNRIAVSGGVNVDLGKWGNRNAAYMGENYQRLSLNDAYLNVSASINDWTKAFASISYNNATSKDAGTLGVGEYSAAYSNNAGSGAGSNGLQLEQAYMTLANFDQTPVFVQIGKQFQDFGRYEIHPIERSLTQVMSETLATSGKIGFIVPTGFNGSFYVFDDSISKIGQNSKPTNYGISLGYDQPNEQLGWDVGAAYLYNLAGVNDVAHAIHAFTGSSNYNSRTGGVALYADVNSGPFVLGARYTMAAQNFNAADLPQNGQADTTLGVVNPTASGAKPWAAGIQGAYGFEYMGKAQNVYLGYQASRQAAGINVPRSRALVGYGIDMWKGTNLGVEWDRDQAYSAANGGSGNNTNLVSLRAAVKFG